MKKTLIIALTSLFAVGSNAIAQKIQVINNTNCSITLSLAADPSGGSCRTMQKSQFITVGAASTLFYIDPSDLNDNLCGLSYTGPGWIGGYCFTAGVLNTWDGVAAFVGGSPYSLGSASPCFSTSSVTTGPDCTGTNVVLDWNTSGLFPVLNMHY